MLATKIDLDRTTITAPIDGVIGLAQARPRALVTARCFTRLSGCAPRRTLRPCRIQFSAVFSCSTFARGYTDSPRNFPS